MWTLEDLGWTAARQAAGALPEGCAPGRVAVEHRGWLVVYAAEGEVWAETSGHLRHAAAGRRDLPVTGDWVALRSTGDGTGVVASLLPRTSLVARKAAGARTQEQLLAANVDVLLLVAGLDGDFNLRRLERALVMARGSGAEPVLVLNKSDVAENVIAAREAVMALAPGVPVHAVSARTGDGVDALHGLLGRGKAAALLGSSGVGKSTLLNQLLGGARQATAEVRASDSRGRHTTTRRELVVLPGGGLVIDTPGLRELQLWADGEDLEAAFADVETLAAGCRFSDCRHREEPGCAVREAIVRGALPAERLQSHHKLRRELSHLEARQDELVRSERKRQERAIHRAARRFRPR